MTIKLLLVFVFFSIRIAWGLDGGAPLDDFNRANVGPPPSSQWSNPLIPAQIGMKVVGNALACDIAGLCSAWWNVATFQQIWKSPSSGVMRLPPRPRLCGCSCGPILKGSP